MIKKLFTKYEEIRGKIEVVLFVAIIGAFCSFQGLVDKNLYALPFFLFLIYGIIWCIKDLIETKTKEKEKQ
jgi:hypothetical protein